MAKPAKTEGPKVLLNKFLNKFLVKLLIKLLDKLLEEVDGNPNLDGRSPPHVNETRKIH